MSHSKLQGPNEELLSRWVAQGGTEESYFEQFGFDEEYDVPEPPEIEEEWKRLKESGKSPWDQFMTRDEDPLDSRLLPTAKKN